MLNEELTHQALIALIIKEMEKLKTGPRDNLLLRLKHIVEIIAQTPKWLRKELIADLHKSTSSLLDEFQLILLKIYKKPITVCKIMSIFADYHYEILETENDFKKALSKLDPLLQQLNPTAAKLSMVV